MRHPGPVSHGRGPWSRSVMSTQAKYTFPFRQLSQNRPTGDRTDFMPTHYVMLRRPPPVVFRPCAVEPCFAWCPGISWIAGVRIASATARMSSHFS